MASPLVILVASPPADGVSTGGQRLHRLTASPPADGVSTGGRRLNRRTAGWSRRTFTNVESLSLKGPH